MIISAITLLISALILSQLVQIQILLFLWSIAIRIDRDHAMKELLFNVTSGPRCR